MNEENQKSKIEGWRKMGLGMCAITALSLKETIEFKIAIIIGIIAIVGMLCLLMEKLWKKTDKE